MIKKGLSRLGIFFLYLLSLLPFWFLYFLSDVLFVVLYHFVGYRRAVVKENLANAFPERTQVERDVIERKYYAHLSDLLVEAIKMVSMSKQEMQRRVKALNPEIVQHYFDRGKSITAVAGHYCNWEWAGMEFSIDNPLFVIYKPLSNAVFDEFFIKVRSRFGGVAVPMKQTLRTMVANKNELTVTVFAGDQTPVREEANYFTDFLNQPTAVFLGIEKIAKLIDSVVIFYDMKKVKRGYYTYEIVPLVENAKQAQPHEITEAHVRHLDKIIKEKPEYWLWSHRRWKFKPEDRSK